MGRLNLNELFIIPGVTVSSLSGEELLKSMDKLVVRGGYSCAVNAEKIWWYRKRKLNQEIDAASLRVVDGASIVIIIKLLHGVHVEKIDFPKLCFEHANKSKTRMGLIGGKESTNKKALRCLKLLYPNITSLGLHGYGSVDNIRTFLKTNFALENGIILLGLGSPKQEQLAKKLSSEFPKLFFVCCGGALSNLAGEQKRAPVYIQASNFEWLFRLFMEPRIRMKRIHRLLPVAKIIIELFFKNLFTNLSK